MKQRIDKLLLDKGLCESRHKAQAYVMAGVVFAGGQKVDKPGQLVDDELMIEVRSVDPYVSRGAHKLLGAITAFGIRFTDMICLDLGASSGGFTQVMLEQGAQKVYAVDVGYGQFDYQLRQNERVVLLERQNARYLNQTIIPDKLERFTADLSFISLKLILPAIQSLLADNAQGVLLIKPQFEVGRGLVGKGVITDPHIHLAVLEDMVEFLRLINLNILAVWYSPIKGPKGNREFLFYVENAPFTVKELSLRDVVEHAHKEL